MSERAVAQQQTTNTLQRITSNALNFQRQAVNHDEPTALPEWKGDTLSSDAFAGPSFGHDFSGVPAFTAMVRQTTPLLHTKLMVQRSPKDGTVDSAACPTCPEAVSPQVSEPAEPATETAEPASEPTPTVEPAEPASASAASDETTAPALIVEDSTVELVPGQMTKSEFLTQLQTEVTRTAEDALAGTGRTTADCPYLEYWFGYYNRKNSSHIQRAIHRYAPETATATSARDYIPMIVARVRRSVEVWGRTGEITGVPEGVPTTLPGEAPTENGEGAKAATSPVMFKAREGGARAADDPQAIQRELGEGRPLDSGVRSRMESVFGMDFAHVRTHTDSTATELSNCFNAHAFTVGEHVAFGSGEYRPSTLVGDALIAHELAHVVQQGGSSASVLPMEVGGADCNALEADADKSALGAVSSLWSGAQESLTNIVENAIPRLRSGLKLQRCQRSSSTNTTTAVPPTVVVGNFRNSDSTSPENNCPSCPRTLGIRTTDWKNGMELRGDITGHVPQVQYDFKRTREGGIWKKVGGSWIQRFHDGPGQNDDATDADEDLTPVNNHIYVEDIPGLGSDPSSGDASATEAVLKGSFIEWVNVKVGTGSWTKRSNEFEWHSITWLEKVGGNWRRKAGENEIETGSTTVGTGNP